MYCYLVFCFNIVILCLIFRVVFILLRVKLSLISVMVIVGCIFISMVLVLRILVINVVLLIICFMNEFIIFNEEILMRMFLVWFLMICLVRLFCSVIVSLLCILIWIEINSCWFIFRIGMCFIINVFEGFDEWCYWWVWVLL